MPRATAWAAFYRIPKGWVMMVNTVRRTRLLARAAALGDLQGNHRTRMSEALNQGARYKLAPVQVTALPYETTAEKRRARIESAQARHQPPGARPASAGLRGPSLPSTR